MDSEFIKYDFMLELQEFKYKNYLTVKIHYNIVI